MRSLTEKEIQSVIALPKILRLRDGQYLEKLRKLLIGKKYDMEDISERDILINDCTEEQKRNIQEVINWLADVSAR